MTKREMRRVLSFICLSVGRKGSGIVKDKTLREVHWSVCTGDLGLTSYLGKFSFLGVVLGREDLKQITWL